MPSPRTLGHRRTPIDLPPELWDRIAAFAPLAVQRRLLFVSRFLRNVAQRLLFRVVRLQFGVWESIRPGDVAEEEDIGVITENTARCTNELIERIIHDPAFAKVVKSVHVLSYTMQQGFSHAGAGGPSSSAYVIAEKR
jgi:hypothetical protein